MNRGGVKVSLSWPELVAWLWKACQGLKDSWSIAFKLNTSLNFYKFRLKLSSDISFCLRKQSYVDLLLFFMNPHKQMFEQKKLTTNQFSRLQFVPRQISQAASETRRNDRSLYEFTIIVCLEMRRRTKLLSDPTLFVLFVASSEITKHHQMKGHSDLEWKTLKGKWLRHSFVPHQPIFKAWTLPISSSHRISLA